VTDRTPAPPDPGAAGDARDPELAAALGVPPLDETTRRRLVRRATAEAEGAPPAARDTRAQPVSRLAAATGVAAVLLVGAVVGAVVVSRPDDSTPTAARASSTAPTTAAAPAPESADTESAAPGVVTSAPPRHLGDLGPIAGTGALRRAVDARLDAVAGDRAAAEAVPPCTPADPQVVGLVLVSAVGTVELDGQPRTVLVGPTPVGREQIVVVEQQGCAVLDRIDL